MSTADLLPRSRALHPYARGRLAGQFAELAAGQADMAATLHSLAGCEVPIPVRSMLSAHAAQYEREAALSRSMGRSLDTPERPRERAPLVRPSSPRRVADSEDRRWYVRVSTCYLLRDGVLITTALSALHGDLRAVAASDGLVAEVAAMSEAAAVRRNQAYAVVRDAVRDHGSGISAAALSRIDDLVRELVGPERTGAMPTNPVALRDRAEALVRCWDAACERAVELFASLGLPAQGDEVRRRWHLAALDALAEHDRRWGRKHCVTQAAAAGLLPLTLPGAQPAHAAASLLHPGD
ncbi:hypothetical protein ABZY36_24155 [Streptomyces sp. NPDC006627]|uniref:hypothetical protein n=1 Tax=Streptomyces sp. NPDC006627 TaxID=3154679 RepID=UPI0033AB936A